MTSYVGRRCQRAQFQNDIVALPNVLEDAKMRVAMSGDHAVALFSGQRRPGKVAWALYPLLVTFVVVATANHYLTDVFLGALTAGVSALLAQRLLARARPHAWAFAPATA